jgi:hypothetical protein
MNVFKHAIGENTNNQKLLNQIQSACLLNMSMNREYRLEAGQMYVLILDLIIMGHCLK